jgi:hypothetical protein
MMLLSATVFSALFLGASGGNPSAASISAVDARDYGPCGPVALYCVCRLLGREENSLANIHALAGAPDAQKRHSLADISKAATALGLHPIALAIPASELRSAPLPAIAHMRYSSTQNRDHFVTVVDCSDEGVLIVDAPHNPVRVTWDSFTDGFAGHALCFAQDAPGRAAVAGQYLAAGEMGAASWLALIDLALLLGYAACKAGRLCAADVSAPGRHLARRVPRILVAATGFCAVVFAARPFVIAAFSTSPALAVDDTVELGALAVGKHQHSVELLNVGDAELIVRGATSTCGCTTADYPESVPPGGSGTLALEIDVTHGAGHSTVTIDSNDPGPPRVVEVYWVGPRKPALVPASIVADDARFGQTFNGRMALRYVGYKGMTMHPSVQLLTAGDDKDRLRVRAIDGPRLVESGVGERAANHEYEVGLEVSVDSPASPGHVDLLAHLRVKYGEEIYELRLPVSVDFAWAEGSD